MNQEYYSLANRIDSSGEQTMQNHNPKDDATGKNCKQEVLAAIRAEKSRFRKKRLSVAAACLAVIAAATGIFHKEVQAAIEQIRYSLSTVIGKDISRYRESFDSSVSDAGYIITLQEAVADRKEIYVSYTIRREDGSPVKLPCTIAGMLYVNGQKMDSGGGGSCTYLDEAGTILGCEVSYPVYGVDLSGKNRYELKFEDMEQEIKGNWDFEFEADSSQLTAETKQMELGDTFTLPDGNVITLDLLSLNEVSQQITFHTSHDGLEAQFELRAVDDKGRESFFQIKSFGMDNGVLENSFISKEDGSQRSWIAGDAKKLSVTAYVWQLPEHDGQIMDEGHPAGAFEWDLTQLK